MPRPDGADRGIAGTGHVPSRRQWGRTAPKPMDQQEGSDAMGWLTGFVLGVVGLAMVAVVAEWLVVGVGAVVVATRKSACGRTDPASPRNLERSFAPDDVSELRTRFAVLLAVPPPAPPPRSPH